MTQANSVDRSTCQERECYCHDDTSSLGAMRTCSQCGCRFIQDANARARKLAGQWRAGNRAHVAQTLCDSGDVALALALAQQVPTADVAALRMLTDAALRQKGGPQA